MFSKKYKQKLIKPTTCVFFIKTHKKKQKKFLTPKIFFQKKDNSFQLSLAKKCIKGSVFDLTNSR